jgi:hypothetical protein
MSPDITASRTYLLTKRSDQAEKNGNAVGSGT